MRATRWARWATCALAISICVPALADHPKKSLADCTAFDQADKGDDGVQFTLHNSCSIPVSCAISWKLVCAPDSHKRRAVHASAAKLSLIEGAAQTADASAASCGDASWSIGDVTWTCEPTKD
jgi:hypothetical protein